jgi:hypothetical protein
LALDVSYFTNYLINTQTKMIDDEPGFLDGCAPFPMDEWATGPFVYSKDWNKYKWAEPLNQSFKYELALTTLMMLGMDI